MLKPHKPVVVDGIRTTRHPSLLLACNQAHMRMIGPELGTPVQGTKAPRPVRDIGNWGGREVQLMTSRSVKMGAAVAGGVPRDQTESLQKKRPKHWA